MASVSPLSIISLFIIFSLSSAAIPNHPRPPHHRGPSLPHHNRPTSTKDAINLACKATRNPEKCEASLVNSNNVPPNPNPTQIIDLAVRVTTEKVNLNHSVAANHSLEILHLSEYRLSQTAEALPRGGIKDARAWMSAVVSYHYDCWSAWKNVNDGQTMAFFEWLIELASDALSMMVSYDRFGKDTKNWKPPMTERVGDWEGMGGPGSGLGYKGGFPSGLKEVVTVCKGRCKYRKVQEAVDAAPSNDGVQRFVIRIKEGAV